MIEALWYQPVIKTKTISLNEIMELTHTLPVHIV